MKSYPKYRFIVLLGLFLSMWMNCLWAQPPGYLGKRMGVSAGFSLNPVLVGLPTKGSLNYEGVNTLLPPKLSIGLEYVFKNRWSVRGGVSRFSMPDVKFYVSNVTRNGAVATTVVDSFQVRSNMSSFYLGFRVYKEYAPYGKYLAFGMGGSRVQSTLYTTTFTQLQSDGGFQAGTIEKLEPESYTFRMPNIYLGKGRQAIAYDRYTIDYGAKFYWFFGKMNSPDIRTIRDVAGNSIAYGQRINLEDLLGHVITIRSLETHFFEFYLNVGFIK